MILDQEEINSSCFSAVRDNTLKEIRDIPGLDNVEVRIVSKNDKMNEIIDEVINTIIEMSHPILLLSTSAAIQKLVSIVEIAKNQIQSKTEVSQYNKITYSLETKLKLGEKEEILNAMSSQKSVLKRPILNILLMKKSDCNDLVEKGWNLN